MKILLATDGSAHSNAMVKKFAEHTFAPNTKVRNDISKEKLITPGYSETEEQATVCLKKF